MNYKNYNDYELIYMVRENDDASYGVLFQKYKPLIHQIAYKYYKDFSHYGFDLDDFIQEAYVAFQGAINIFDEGKDILFYTFATMCMERKLLTFCSRITYDKKNISNTYFVPIEDVSIFDHNLLENEVYQQDLIRKILNTVYEFDFSFICVFELRFNNFTYPEIERILDIPSRKANFMYQRVVKAIKRKLLDCL